MKKFVLLAMVFALVIGLTSCEYDKKRDKENKCNFKDKKEERQNFIQERPRKW